MSANLDLYPGRELRLRYGRETQAARVEGRAGRFVILRRFNRRRRAWNKQTDRWERTALERFAVPA
jgi:hypothetical protein